MELHCKNLLGMDKNICTVSVGFKHMRFMICHKYSPFWWMGMNGETHLRWINSSYSNVRKIRTRKIDYWMPSKENYAMFKAFSFNMPSV